MMIQRFLQIFILRQWKKLDFAHKNLETDSDIENETLQGTQCLFQCVKMHINMECPFLTIE